MIIEDEIYIPHVCHSCGIARLILRDDLNDNPKIPCTECEGTMRRWILYKKPPFTNFDGGDGSYLSYTQKRKETIGNPWNQSSGFSLADVRKDVGRDLVDYPGMPNMIFLPSEYEGAQLRAEMMKEKIEDVVVTLVLKIKYANPVGIIHVESLPYSQLAGRITKLKHLTKEQDGTVFVITAYSEETSQEYWWNDLELETKPRLPGYGQEYDKKRKAYRTPASGVIR